MIKSSLISDNIAGSSIVGGILYLTLSAIFLMVPLKIFPDLVFGNLFITITTLNAATGPQTDRDAAVLEQGLPSIGKTKKANEILVDMIKGTNYRIIEKEQLKKN